MPTHFKLMSCSNRLMLTPPVAAFLTSPMDRLMPPMRFFRIRHSVNAALINIPPIAIGRTIYRQMVVA